MNQLEYTLCSSPQDCHGGSPQTRWLQIAFTNILIVLKAWSSNSRCDGVQVPARLYKGYILSSPVFWWLLTFPDALWGLVAIFLLCVCIYVFLCQGPRDRAQCLSHPIGPRFQFHLNLQRHHGGVWVWNVLHSLRFGACGPQLWHCFEGGGAFRRWCLFDRSGLVINGVFSKCLCCLVCHHRLLLLWTLP